VTDLEIRPVSADRWDELVDLFERPGPRGAWPRPSACYCMFWRLPSAEYEEAFRARSLDNRSGGPNKEKMAALVAGGVEPGLLAVLDGRPVGWVAVSPRSELVRLESSPGLRSEGKPADDATWAISCFYVHRLAWRSGVATALLEAAVARAADRGATAVEAYPVKAGNIDPYTGYDTMFVRAGFRQAKAGRGRGRSLYRLEMSKSERPASTSG
jgi:GNAT superfamily N-acetyltransferase